MPKLLRLYLLSIATGFCLALAFTTLLIVLDVAGLRHLVTSTRGGVIAVIMLVWFNTLLFSGVQFGYVVMRLGRKRNGGGGKTSRQPIARADMAPVRQAVTTGGSSQKS